ncbi:unnamed protein product [Durusdinium trenchii]|uniref:Uncharacterized protein n=1 Tax=Durusdinium trenchii TaxID=1381693 RepID=A0ABP0SXJ7_9DINO
MRTCSFEGQSNKRLEEIESHARTAKAEDAARSGAFLAARSGGVILAFGREDSIFMHPVMAAVEAPKVIVNKPHLFCIKWRGIRSMLVQRLRSRKKAAAAGG